MLVGGFPHHFMTPTSLPSQLPSGKNTTTSESASPFPFACSSWKGNLIASVFPRQNSWYHPLSKAAQEKNPGDRYLDCGLKKSSHDTRGGDGDDDELLTCEFAKEFFADQPEQGADVQLQLLLGQVDAKLIQRPREAGVHITHDL